ncbi:MAG: glycosyl hydrolase [Flavobacteriaceae bacterium]|nr:glycosyl hydrolase [Flavobacteriaceae bacterium]
MKNTWHLMLSLVLALGLTAQDVQAQRKKKAAAPAKEVNINAFKFRNVGPAFLSGRIADIAIHPDNDNHWYVAVGSAGVWKTENAGTTWIPLFDNQKSYSTGCVSIDPSNPSTIWVGSGENVGGRHVGYGDGIYRSDDNGKSWKNMGLNKSEHISKIIVHPDNSNTIWVAAQGPLWSKGGERGVYKSTDGGSNWKQVLGNNEWTGATDLLIDPRNPQVLYAATWDRHRTVAAYMGGGPGTAIYKSTDGGENWAKIHNGLPRSNMGKIGLAISPQNPDVVYAAIELDRTKGGVFRSANAGGFWTKMSNTVSGGTGPHYYQELYASPHKFDRLYLMNVRILTSEDGGKNFTQLKERQKHSDNHAIAFKKDDPNYLMIGTDAGIYESFDLAENWKYHKNLPLTQFYKVAVNNAKPFYHIFGGTQDNGSAGGPSATDEREGISNKHWYKTLGADGHQSATDPEFNNIIYAETQQGGLHRVDLVTGEQVYVQPQAQKGDPHERFNWDAPILVSPHKASTIYFASYRVWKSEDRGDSWTPISSDLTRNENRIELPIMGRKQSWDNAWDVNAMSNYNTITSLSESPVQKGLLYAGTDDGFVHVSENDGQTWTKIPVSQFGLPGRSFVNDIRADLHDPNTVYVALDNHKEGDFRPFLYKSTDRGKTWKSMSSNIPKNTLIWRIVQDHVNPELMFLATEFGIYVTLNGGQKWQKMKGTPNMSFRDITIQREENDVVAASFGRGFYVLDDYSPLRNMNKAAEADKGMLFAPRTAKWYVPRSNLGNTGADYYIAKNPEYGAVFTYYLNDNYSTAKQARKKREGRLNKGNKDVPFPGYDELDKENSEKSAMVYLTIKDGEGHIIKHLKRPARKGSHRIAWNMRHDSGTPINPKSSSRGWFSRGPMVIPGTYTASLSVEKDGEFTAIGEEVSFDLEPIYEGTLKGISYEDYESYRKGFTELRTAIEILSHKAEKVETYMKGLNKAVDQTNQMPSNFKAELVTLENKFSSLSKQIEGSPSRNEIGERNPPSISNHFSVAFRGLSTTYGPTKNHTNSMNLAKEMLSDIQPELDSFIQEVQAFAKKLENAGAPMILGSL